MNANIQLTEEQEAEIGRQLAKALYLKRDRDHKDRWETGWGTKTNLGLYRTVKSIVSQNIPERKTP